MKTVSKEVQKQREKNWHQTKIQDILNTFSPRILKVIKNNKFETFNSPMKCSYIHGAARTGKSVFISWMILEWSRTQFMNRKSISFKFTSVHRLLEDLRETYNDNEAKNNLINELKSVKLLVLDDFGAEKTTEWAFQMLYDVIDYRYNHFLTTFYTSNLSLEELSEKLADDRITSRIAQDCKENIIEFKNKPYI